MSQACLDGGLTLKFAKQHVDAYNVAKDSLIEAHQEAMDCYDCEAFLQLGIDAFDWLVRSDYVLRQAIYSEQYEYDPEVDKAIQSLSEAWLAPCKHAFGWAARQKERGFTVFNLGRFEQCCNEMKAIVDSYKSDNVMSEALVTLMEEALQEYKDGKTAEFF